MAETTGIEWADKTWNPWIGCVEVSPGCEECYARTDQDERRGRAKWGTANAGYDPNAKKGGGILDGKEHKNFPPPACIVISDIAAHISPQGIKMNFSIEKVPANTEEGGTLKYKASE